MRAAIAVAIASMTLIGASAPAGAYARHHGAYYRSSDGSMVHVPYKGRHAGETAVCRDGSHSMSHHHRGTCSHHGGVARFER